MKATLFSALVLAVALLAFAPAAALAQQAAGHNIAVVDVSVIFKDHIRFKQAIEQMKGQVTLSENELKTEFERMKKMAEQLKSLNAGSPDYKKLENDIAKAELDFKFKRAQAAKEFAERESKLYYQIYLEIDQVVKELAVRNNIALVLRHHSDQVDPNDRNEILRGINKPIVYVNPTLDVTQHILAVLNRGAAPATTTAPGANGATTQRPGVQGVQR